MDSKAKFKDILLKLKEKSKQQEMTEKQKEAFKQAVYNFKNGNK